MFYVLYIAISFKTNIIMKKAFLRLALIVFMSIFSFCWIFNMVDQPEFTTIFFWSIVCGLVFAGTDHVIRDFKRVYKIMDYSIQKDQDHGEV